MWIDSVVTGLRLKTLRLLTLGWASESKSEVSWTKLDGVLSNTATFPLLEGVTIVFRYEQPRSEYMHERRVKHDTLVIQKSMPLLHERGQLRFQNFYTTPTPHVCEICTIM